MANFLHDQNFENVTIDEARLKQIDKIFKDQQTIINSQNGDKEKSAILSYIIRFDSKGYRIFEFEKML